MESFNTTGDKLIEESKIYADTGYSVILSPLFHKTTVDVVMKVASVKLLMLNLVRYIRFR